MRYARFPLRACVLWLCILLMCFLFVPVEIDSIETGGSGAENGEQLTGSFAITSGTLGITDPNNTVASATTYFAIDAADDAEPNITYIKVRDDSDGTPQTLFVILGSTTRNGQVGIGTSPDSASMLHIYNVGYAELLLENDGGAGGATFRAVDTGSSSNWAFKTTSSGNFKLRDMTNTTDMLTLMAGSTAQIGVGATEGDMASSVGALVVQYGGLEIHELSADPSDPPEGSHVIWQSDGTGSGDDGDVMIKITAGATTKTITLVDFSAF